MSGEGLHIGNEDELLIVILQFDPAFQASHIVPDMKLACCPVTGKNSFHFALIVPFCFSVFIPQSLWGHESQPHPE